MTPKLGSRMPPPQAVLLRFPVFASWAASTGAGPPMRTRTESLDHVVPRLSWGELH